MKKFTRGFILGTLTTLGAVAGSVAAAVDVFDQEPLPKDDPWFSTPNVLLTPHCAGNTKECMDRMAVDAASEVVRVLNGENRYGASISQSID